MGRKPINKERIEDPAIKLDWRNQLTPLLMDGQLHDETMDTIASKVGVSKATFYKHFSSKEALLTDVINYKIEQIANFSIVLFDENKSYQERYMSALQQATQELAGISNNFLVFLQKKHLPLWEKIEALIDLCTQCFNTFYNDGIESGVLNEFDAHLMAMTDRVIISSITTNPIFLKKNNISIEAFVNQYFQMKRKAIFKESNSPKNDLSLN